MRAAKAADERQALAAASLRAGVEAIGLELDSAHLARLMQYLDLLAQWNRVYNLTAIRDIDRMVSAHLLDSLSVLPHITGERVLDVGSGAGLPGIPIAVANPQRQVVLLDSSHKKTAFLRQASATLALANISVVCERVESWRAEADFDLIISRAFAEISEFVELSRHLLAPEGVIVAMKGVYPYEEIERIPRGFVARRVIALEVPGLSAARHLVLIGRQ